MTWPGESGQWPPTPPPTNMQGQQGAYPGNTNQQSYSDQFNTGQMSAPAQSKSPGKGSGSYMGQSFGTGFGPPAAPAQSPVAPPDLISLNEVFGRDAPSHQTRTAEDTGVNHHSGSTRPSFSEFDPLAPNNASRNNMYPNGGRGGPM